MVKTRLLSGFFIALCVSGCPGNGPASVDDRGAPSASLQAPVFSQQRVPFSRRSKRAVERVAPGLMADLGDKGLAYGSAVFMRIFKQERELEVWLQSDDSFVRFRTYSIAGMSGSLGPKLREGDRQAPEGFYFVSPSRMNPNSSQHLSFNLGYPNQYDRAHGRTGSALMVHGGRGSVGCYAMTDRKIEEIYALADAALRNGQKFFRVHCFPFRMNEKNMNRYADSEWHEFWQNLKIGYDFFESTKCPPNVEVEAGRYVFETDPLTPTRP